MCKYTFNLFMMCQHGDMVYYIFFFNRWSVVTMGQKRLRTTAGNVANLPLELCDIQTQTDI